MKFKNETLYVLELRWLAEDERERHDDAIALLSPGMWFEPYGFRPPSVRIRAFEYDSGSSPEGSE